MIDLPAEGAERKALSRHKLHVALSACYCNITADFRLVGGHMAVGVWSPVWCLQGTEALGVSVRLSVKRPPGGWIEGGAPLLTGRRGRSGA